MVVFCVCNFFQQIQRALYIWSVIRVLKLYLKHMFPEGRAGLQLSVSLASLKLRHQAYKVSTPWIPPSGSFHLLPCPSFRCFSKTLPFLTFFQYSHPQQMLIWILHGIQHLNKSSKEVSLGFPGSSVVKNLPASAEDTGSNADPGRSHMPWSN